MGKILNNFIFGSVVAGAVIGKNVHQTLVGDKELDSIKGKVKEKSKELKSFIDSNKDKLHRSVYFDAKSKHSSFEAKTTRINDSKSMKDLEKEVKTYLENLKKKV